MSKRTRIEVRSGAGRARQGPGRGFLGVASTAALLWLSAGAGRAEVTRSAAPGRGGGPLRRVTVAQVVENPQVPEFHRVQPGDTLWDLCERYFQDPWRWPRLWALNPAITNPHFIYPGDRIRLRPGRRSAARIAPSRPRAHIRLSPGGQPARPGKIQLWLRGFVAEEEVPAEARITGSRAEKILLSTYDHVYIRYPADKPLRVGARYQVYKTDRRVMHPRTRKPVGKIVRLLGEVEVRRLSDAHVAEGVITQAVNPIERGALVGQLRRTLVPLQPVTYRGPQITGMVMAVLGGRNLIGTQQLVFLDVGSEAGVRPGYQFFVTRRGDSYRAIMQFEERVRPEERNWPREAVARIVAIHVGKRYAVGYVAWAAQEIRIGDQVAAGSGRRPARRARAPRPAPR